MSSHNGNNSRNLSLIQPRGGIEKSLPPGYVGGKLEKGYWGGFRVAFRQ